MSRRLLLLIGAVAVFVIVAVASATEVGRRLDASAVGLLRDAEGRPLGPAWVRELIRDLTALGGLALVGLTAIGIAAWQAVAGRWGAALRVIAAIGGAQLTVSLLKLLFARERPGGVEAGQVVHTFSFPSGHATLSAAAFGGLAWVLASRQRSAALRSLAWGFGLLIVAAVGFSRIGLGVHRPSEILAGWCVGAAALCFTVPRETPPALLGGASG